MESIFFFFFFLCDATFAVDTHDARDRETNPYELSCDAAQSELATAVARKTRSLPAGLR